MPATQAKSRKINDTRRSFREVVDLSTSKIDETAGVIRNVKVLGFDSRNGRRYTREACQKALKKYENCPVYLNHSNKEARGLEEKVGWISSPRLERDGIYGDLNLLKSDPNTGKIIEMAKRNPSQCGLSHNVEGNGFTSQDGVYEVHEIVEVNSVDLVDKPATTNGLFEGVSKMNLSAMFERVADRLPAKKADALRRFLEDGEMPIDAEAPPESATADPNEALTAGFEQVATTLLKSILGGEMDPKEGLKKLGTLIKTHFNLTTDGTDAGGEEEEPKKDEADGPPPVDDKKEGEDEPDGDEKKEAEDDDEKKEEEDDDAKDKKESLARRVARLEAENHVLTLAESLAIRLTDIQRKAAAGLSKPERKQFIESLKRKSDRNGPVIDARSSGPGVDATPKAESYDDFLAAIRG